MNMGWVCPKCGRCYAPNVSKCFTCGQSESASEPMMFDGEAAKDIQKRIDPARKPILTNEWEDAKIRAKKVLDMRDGVPCKRCGNFICQCTMEVPRRWEMLVVGGELFRTTELDKCSRNEAEIIEVMEVAK